MLKKDIVNTYTHGIDPEIQEKIFEKINSIFNNFFDVIQSESNNSLSYEFSNQYGNKINEVGKKLQKQIEETLTNIQKSKYFDPFVTMSGFLGKEELSTLAEALVNLTSIRRKFSTDDETVGGETDVALITKGDGFKWIKKKVLVDVYLQFLMYSRLCQNYNKFSKRIFFTPIFYEILPRI